MLGPGLGPWLFWYLYAWGAAYVLNSTLGDCAKLVGGPCFACLWILFSLVALAAQFVLFWVGLD